VATAEALRRARLALLRAGKAPFFWGPFVLIGASRPSALALDPPPCHRYHPARPATRTKRRT
jgi:hypothetical protein